MLASKEEGSFVVVLICHLSRRVTSTYMFPYKEDLIRFDFEIAPEDEHMWHFLPIQGMKPQ